MIFPQKKFFTVLFLKKHLAVPACYAMLVYELSIMVGLCLCVLCVLLHMVCLYGVCMCVSCMVCGVYFARVGVCVCVDYLQFINKHCMLVYMFTSHTKKYFVANNTLCLSSDPLNQFVGLQK